MLFNFGGNCKEKQEALEITKNASKTLARANICGNYFNMLLEKTAKFFILKMTHSGGHQSSVTGSSGHHNVNKCATSVGDVNAMLALPTHQNFKFSPLEIAKLDKSHASKKIDNLEVYLKNKRKSKF